MIRWLMAILILGATMASAIAGLTSRDSNYNNICGLTGCTSSGPTNAMLVGGDTTSCILAGGDTTTCIGD